jgi:ribosomal protein S12 methylthiotransferase
LVPSSSQSKSVALLTLGCARNEVDSEELAARLAGDGWTVSTDGSNADVVLVNTCGFVEKAKQDSIETLLAAAGTGAKVVATGCMAERYGRELAESLPEASAVLGFDHYPTMAATLDAVLRGEQVPSHSPQDRRKLLPITPALRKPTDGVIPGHGWVNRKRLTKGPVASLKLASGCDRRCAFCAIPSFRGSFISRVPDELLAEAEWLAGTGVRELVLVSENSTSYGKDLGDPRALEKLLPQLAAIDGIVRVRVSYLQPAETRPGLVEAIGSTPGVAPYFDLSFQHASEPVLRRMRRFGSTSQFLALLDSARAIAPEAGARSNFIVGFPGETPADFSELERFLTLSRLDAIGVFDYSDEDGTEAATMDRKVSRPAIKRRYEKLLSLSDELCSQRASERVGSLVDVLVDVVDDDIVEGRAAHQAPEVDGSTTLIGAINLRPGDLVQAKVLRTEGVDLVAEPVAMLSAVVTNG